MTEKKSIKKKTRSENYWSTKILVGKIFGRQNFWSSFFFSIEKNRPQKIFFDQLFFSTKMFLNFFRRKKLSMKKIWLPIPMGNFPKIPKITLITACKHFKKQLEQKVTVYVLLAGKGPDGDLSYWPLLISIDRWIGRFIPLLTF